MPAKKDIHIDTPMTQISIAYRPQGFIVSQFPIVNVAKDSDKFFKFDGDSWLRDEAEERADGTVGAEGDYDVSSDSYTCVPYSFTKWVSDEERKRSDNPLAPDRNATEFVTDKLLIKTERLAQAAVFTAGSWAAGHSSTLSGAAQWDDFAGSDPIQDIEDAKAVIEPKIGRPGEEMTIILGRQVYRYARRHPLIQAQLGSQERKLLSAEQLAQIFDVKKVLVGSASYNSAAENDTASYGFIWGDKAWIGYLPERAELEKPSAFYVMSYNPSGLPTAQGVQYTFIERVRQDKSNGHLENRTGFRGSTYIVVKITSNIAGYLYSDVLST
jgi:hypothetical protein